MDTDIANRVITEITSRLGVGYSVFSDAVAQYAQAKATESLIFSVMFFVVAFLAIAIFFFAVFLNRSMDTATKAFLGFLLVIILLFTMLPGTCALAGYINWLNAPQGMFLQEIIKSIK